MPLETEHIRGYDQHHNPAVRPKCRRGKQLNLLRKMRYASDPLSDAFHDDDEIVEGRKIYKNPRNAPSESCPRDEEAILRTGRTCLRKCISDEDCLSRRKVCLCDSICGLSCIKPDKECGELDNPMFGMVEVNGKIVGSKAHYRCQEGYHLIGTVERQCQANGIWTAITPECRENLYCTDPPVFPNARHNGLTGQTRFEVNKTLKYSCYEGYITKGFDRAKCLLYNNTMQWFGPEIHCEPKICGDPGEINNGFKEGSCFAFSCRVNYHCRPGFELVGRSTYYCQHDGAWNPRELPECTPVQCEIPENPENGKAVFIAVSYNAVVSYECNYSYMIVGSSTRRCGPDKKWSGVQPQCKQINCGSPGVLYNGWLDGSQTTFGAAITFRCNDNMKYEGHRGRETKCLQNGTWSHPLPKCFEINCGHPGHLSNGWLENIDQGTALGSSIIFRCFPNMTIEGDQSTVCQADGTWSKTPPMCLAPCIVPSIEYGVIQNKTRTGTQVSHGSVIDVQCDVNFELTYSLAPSICYNGTWTHYPRCQPARCKSLPTRPRYGMVIAPRTDHGKRARYRCKDGYRLEGQSTTECYYGTWNGTTPSCLEVYCPFPGVLTNGRVLLVGNMGMYDYRSYVKKVRNNRQIRYACNKGFFLVRGPPGATCVAGRWSPKELPSCDPDLHPRIHWIKRSVNISEYEEAVNQLTPDTVVLSTATEEDTSILDYNGVEESVDDPSDDVSKEEQDTEEVPEEKEEEVIKEIKKPLPKKKYAVAFVAKVPEVFPTRFVQKMPLSSVTPTPLDSTPFSRSKRSINVPEYEEVMNQTTTDELDLSTITIEYTANQEHNGTKEFDYNGSDNTSSDDEEEEEEDDETIAVEEEQGVEGNVAEIFNGQPRASPGWFKVSSPSNSSRVFAAKVPATIITRMVPKVEEKAPPPAFPSSFVSIPTSRVTPSPISKSGHDMLENNIGQDNKTHSSTDALNLGKRLRGPLVDFYRLLRIENGSHEFDKKGLWPSLKRVPRNIIDKKEKKERKHKRRNNRKKKGKKIPHCELIRNEQYQRVEVIRKGHDDNFTYSAGVRVKVTCLHGYGLNIGNRTAKCAKGNWKPSKPECVTLPCSVPEASHGQFEFNGVVIPESSTVSHGEVVKFSCQSGYNVLGSETMRCWYGAWAVTGKNPECQPDPCVLPDLPHGKYDSGYKKSLTIIHGAKVDYTCDEGWFRNVSDVSCYLGVLRPSPPACVVPGQAIDIINNEPAPVKRGGHSAAYNNGDLTPGGDITILSHSSHKLNCNPPTEVPGSTVYKNGKIWEDGDNNFPDGTKLLISCSHNSMGEKNSWDMRCADGNWQSHKFPTSCAPDGADEQNFGNKSCKWTKSEPHVVTFFKDEEVMEESVEFEPGDELVSRCKDIGKFTIRGSNRQKCIHGIWEGEKPTCIGLNQEYDYALDKGPTILFRNEKGPMAQSNDGKLVVYPGTVLHLECLFQRRHGTPKWNVSLSSIYLKGKKKIRKAKAKGQKDARKGKRIGTFVPYPNGWANAPNRDMQLEYRLSIYKAAEKDSGSYACVTPTGHNHTVTLDIKKVECPDLLLNKSESANNLKFEPEDDRRMSTIVKFKCDPGSSLVGAVNVKCLPSGRWSAPIPSCENIECPDPRAKVGDSRLRVTVLSRGVGGGVVFTCPRGYNATGPARAVCLESGRWSSPAPTCKEAKCVPPEPPKNGVMTGSGPFHAGDAIEVKCNANYMMEGQPIMVCQEDGQWSDEVPKCSIACTYPGTIISGTMSSVKFYYPINDNITYTCSSGFALKGARSIFCREGGKWSDAVPSCIPRP